MITLNDITPRVAVESLRSTLCPACGGVKKTRQTLCHRDYFKLPKQLRVATYDPLGSGYQEAVVEALNFLNVQTLHLPQPAPAGGGA